MGKWKKKKTCNEVFHRTSSGSKKRRKKKVYSIGLGNDFREEGRGECSPIQLKLENHVVSAQSDTFLFVPRNCVPVQCTDVITIILLKKIINHEHKNR